MQRRSSSDTDILVTPRSYIWNTVIVMTLCARKDVLSPSNPVDLVQLL